MRAPIQPRIIARNIIIKIKEGIREAMLEPARNGNCPKTSPVFASPWLNVSHAMAIMKTTKSKNIAGLIFWRSMKKSALSPR
ncbi:MAG: hypothetical protein AAB777_00415 [Patescibacteria group bacterium]